MGAPTLEEAPFWLPARRDVAVVRGRLYAPGRMLRALQGDERARGDLEERGRIRLARQHARGVLVWHALSLLSKRFRWEEAKAELYGALLRRAREGALPDEAERERMVAGLRGTRLFPIASEDRARRYLADALAEATRSGLPVSSMGPPGPPGR